MRSRCVTTAAQETCIPGEPARTMQAFSTAAPGPRRDRAPSPSPLRKRCRRLPRPRAEFAWWRAPAAGDLRGLRRLRHEADTALEPCGELARIGESAHQNCGNRGSKCPDRREGLRSFELGHADIEDDDVRDARVLLEEGNRFEAVAGREYGETVPLEGALRHDADGHLVLGEKHRDDVGHSKPYPRACARGPASRDRIVVADRREPPSPCSSRRRSRGAPGIGIASGSWEENAK
jgi:hypothetical protein